MTSRKQGRNTNKKVIKVDEEQIKQEIKVNKKRKKTSKKMNFTKVNVKKCVFVLAVIILVCISMYVIQNYHRFGLVAVKDITQNDANVIELLTSDYTLTQYGKNILVYEQDKITAYNSAGKGLWQVEIEESFNTQMTTSGKYIQVINKDTGNIYVLDGQYIICKIKIDGSILSGTINKNGVSVIEYTTSGVKTVLAIYDKKGNQQYDIKLDTNTVSSYSLSDNMNYLAYASVDIAGISLNSTVNVINLKANDMNNAIEKIISENNELVYNIQWNSNKLYFLMDNKVVIYNLKKKQKQEIDTYNMDYSYVGIDKNNIAGIIDEGEGGLLYSIKKYDGDLKKYNQLTGTPKYFNYINGISFITYSKSMEIYNSFGVCIKTYKSDNLVTEPVVFNDAKSVAYAVSNKIFIFTI